MNEFQKNRILRFARKFGIETIKNPNYIRPLHDPRNFPDAGETPVIFDIGANIGQSVFEFKHSYENTSIYAFEPVASVFETLESNTKKLSGVSNFHLGFGEQKAELQIPKVKSKTIQTTQVLGDHGDSTGESETIEITTVDDFSKEQGISKIDILKTDTEGFDLAVCRGMKNMLTENKVGYIISEVTIIPGDTQHTNI